MIPVSPVPHHVMVFQVTIERDKSGPDREFEPGFEPLFEDADIEVSFLDDDRGPELEPQDLQGADAYVSFSYDLTAESLEGVDTLKIATRSGAGYDNFDIDAMTDAGVIATHAPQGPTASAAQAATGMIISCAHNFPRHEHVLRTQGFAGRSPDDYGFELQHATVGFIGMGLIARRVLENLQPFRDRGMEAMVFDPYLSDEDAEELGVETADLSTVLGASDIVSIHVPLTDETHHMIGSESFETMQESAVLVNTARGGIYPDAALADALHQGKIRGAAVDVFEDEPNVEGNPLLEIPDIHLTPHISGPTTDAIERMRRIMSEAIVTLKNGDPPDNVLNPEAYETQTGESLPDAAASPSYQP